MGKRATHHIIANAEAFLAQVARDGYLPESIVRNPELIELVEPALRTDYQAVECPECP